MIKVSRKNVTRKVSLIVLALVLTFGSAVGGHNENQALRAGVSVQTDSAAVLAVGGSEDAGCLVGLALIAIGMSGLLGTVESLATIAAGILLLGPCFY